MFLNVDALCFYTHNKTHYVTSLQRSCEKSSVFTGCQPAVFMQLPDAKLAVCGKDFLPRLFYISVQIIQHTCYYFARKTLKVQNGDKL